ncbi:MAG: hypothetical protein IPO58_11250 [Betaproteobacteria bacterium]|nr:hypothetical protein [Betaproteobacteria bacterium]
MMRLPVQSMAKRPRRPVPGAGRARNWLLSGDLRACHGTDDLRLVSRHDRARYDIVLYSLSPVRDAFTARLQALGVPMVDLGSCRLPAPLRRIRWDGIDLLIRAPATRAARSPGSWRSSPRARTGDASPRRGRSGLRAIDYKLTSRWPERRCASNSRLRAPAIGARRRVSVAALSSRGGLERTAVGLDPGAFVCGAFVSLMKLSPAA